MLQHFTIILWIEDRVKSTPCVYIVHVPKKVQVYATFVVRVTYSHINVKFKYSFIIIYL